MELLSKTISAIARTRYAAIKQWKTNAIESQHAVFQNIIANGQFTTFGQVVHMEQVHNYADFKQAVPIHQYETIYPYIQKTLRGKENILWNTSVEWFAKSSGTTNANSKFIPITPDILKQNHFKASKDVVTNYYEHYPDSKLLTGKSLVVGGSHQISTLNNQIKYGDLSAVLMQNIPLLGKHLRTPALKIALMDNWADKLEALAQATAYENVTSIAGVPTWTLLLLKRILEITGKHTIGEVWPNLEIYFNGGVSFVPYQHEFISLIGKPIQYLEMYNASEGFFAAQEPDTPIGIHNITEKKDDGLLLFTEHGVFYEFATLDEFQKDNPQTISLEHIQIGVNYVMIVTTVGGLWRYVIGDTVKFTSINPYKLKISGRTKHFINVFGEEVIVDNADQALAAAAQATHAAVADYTVAPIFLNQQTKGAHEWLIEFSKTPDNKETFVQVLDTTLKNINSDYEAKRQANIALSLPHITYVPTGTFAKWLRAHNKEGGQNKIPRLSNERTFVEQIKTLLA